tara:strand:- start:483 stop:1028 length:546 start_codon:yes stop_codon:yes gene_type:complete
MKYNLYKYNLLNSSFSNLNTDDLPNSVKRKLIIIEQQIIIEFLKKQQNKPGIKRLGNEIKKNKIINDSFNNSTENGELLFKLTSHYQSYINSIVKALYSSFGKKVYLFVLDEEFRYTSKLVDSSSKGALFIKEILDKISYIFNPTKYCNNYLYIVEMKDFREYFVIERGEYSHLKKKKNAR